MSEQINHGYYVNPETAALYEYSGYDAEFNLLSETQPEQITVEPASVADFFTAVDKVELNPDRQRQVRDVLDYLITSGNTQLIAQHIDNFLARIHHETLALKLINNGLWGIVENNMSKFEDPDVLKRLAPGL